MSYLYHHDFCWRHYVQIWALTCRFGRFYPCCGRNQTWRGTRCVSASRLWNMMIQSASFSVPNFRERNWAPREIMVLGWVQLSMKAINWHLWEEKASNEKWYPRIMNWKFKRAWIFSGIFFVFWDFFLFSGLASFSLRFPLVFLHFPYFCPLFSIDFPCFSLVFHWFYFNFLIFPLFSIGFPWFSLFFHCFACISSLFHCFASFRYVFIGLIAFSSFLCVFLLQFSFMFSCFLCFPWVFWFYTAFSSLFCCFYLGYVSLVFLFHWFSYIFLYIMVFSCIGFCSLSSLFSVATYMVGACCCCCCWWWWWWLLLFWCFHVFSVGWRLKATMTMLVNDAAVLLSLHEVAAGGQP